MLKRLLVNLAPNDPKAVDWFELEFAKEVLNKLLSKVPDMYCVTAAADTMCTCFITVNPHNEALSKQIFSEPALVEALFTGISTPILHLPSFNQPTRSAVLKIYQQFTI